MCLAVSVLKCVMALNAKCFNLWNTQKTSKNDKEKQSTGFSVLDVRPNSVGLCWANDKQKFAFELGQVSSKNQQSLVTIAMVPKLSQTE